MSATITRRISVIALIVAQIGVSIAMPFSHQHVLWGPAGAATNIQSHDCGAKEIHKPLDDSCHCLLCLRDSTSIAVLACSFDLPGTYSAPHTERSAPIVLLNYNFLCEPDRGPPSVIA